MSLIYIPWYSTSPFSLPKSMTRKAKQRGNMSHVLCQSQSSKHSMQVIIVTSAVSLNYMSTRLTCAYSCHLYKVPIVPPKNYNRHLGIDCERTLYGIWKIKPDYETMTIFLQFSEDPIWFGQVVTKRDGFCKGSHMSLSPKFCHWNVCGFHRQIMFTKDRLAIILKFYAYLSNKGCSWQPKSLSDM